MTLCNPAILYLVLSIICIVYGFLEKINIGVFFAKFLWIIIWTYLLNFLCSKGYQTISWILVLLPFILIGFMAFMLLEMKYRIEDKSNH
jgi:hypothetical protein